MRYIKPPDFKAVKDLQAYYKKIEQDIARLLTTDASAKTSDELNKKLAQALQAATTYLAKKNKAFAKDELSTAFEEGKGDISQSPKMTASAAAAILEKQGFRYAKNAFSTPLYIELQTATQAAGNGLKSRVNNIIKDLRKDGKDSVYNVQQAIIKDLTDKAIFEVVYSNGAKQPLHAYAAMAARSARIETMNIGAIGRALQMGTDYVKMTTVGQCCALCGAYQGKVYCISGKDKRFPALFKTVLRRGYALPHPNCRHEFVAWFIDMEDPADVEKAIRDSKIRYDKKGNLVDVRWQKDIESYAQWQAGNRQLNNELLEYNRMQKELGKDAPYKTLGAFRRAKRANAQSYQEYRKEWAKKKEVDNHNQRLHPSSHLGDFSNHSANLPKPKGYNQERIKSSNYEKAFQQIVPRNLVRKITVAAREAISENNRKNEETTIAFSLTGERILKQHSPSLVIEVDMREIRKQPADSIILLHNHPQNDSFSDFDLNFMQNEQIHTLIACGHDGKIFSLRTNCGKTVDEFIVSEYNRNIDAGLTREEALRDMAKEYRWEYMEL